MTIVSLRLGLGAALAPRAQPLRPIALIARLKRCGVSGPRPCNALLSTRGLKMSSPWAVDGGGIGAICERSDGVRRSGVEVADEAGRGFGGLPIHLPSGEERPVLR